jgi:hypothetical protein
MTEVGEQRGDKIRCEACAAAVPTYDVVSYGSIEQGYRQLCSRCFNAEVAAALGLEHFENARLHPVVMADSAGERHEFHLRLRLLGSKLALDSFEVRNGAPAGYQFQMLGEPEEEPLSLLARLVERMRRTLAVKHLVRGQDGTQISGKNVRGRIEWDESEGGRVPLLVIDGHEVCWDEFGQMLMSFEGWQFRLEIVDRSEDG